MSERESELLNKIWNDIKEVKDDIRATKLEVVSSGIKIAETVVKVEQLHDWIININTKIEELEKTGCPVGRVNKTIIDNHDNQLSEIKEDIKNLEYSKKEAVTIGTASGAAGGTVLSAIFQALMALLGK